MLFTFYGTQTTCDFKQLTDQADQIETRVVWRADTWSESFTKVVLIPPFDIYPQGVWPINIENEITEVKID